MSKAVDLAPLANMMWHTLAGAHAGFALSSGAARRYAPGFSAMLAFADLQDPDFAGANKICEVGETFYISRWAGTPPPGWEIRFETRMHCMLWQGQAPQVDPAPEAVRLDARHAEEALALAQQMRPGPFGLRTIELGEYFGIFIDGRLAAMAGERMQSLPLHEISGVCTHPDFQGQGLARRLTEKIIMRQCARGETPFLHVMGTNTAALNLYRGMGFATHFEPPLRIIERMA